MLGGNDNMRTRISGDKLRALDRVPFEQWPQNGVKLRAVSANGDGIVNSGILQDGRYFYRVWEPSGWWKSGIQPTSRLVFDTETR